jgi:hypothetical protein
MKLRLLGLLLTFSIFQGFAQDYQFRGTISQQVLNNYLDRAITMQGQSDVEGNNMLSEPERLRNITMLQDVGAKFVGRLGGWWDSGWGQDKHDAIFAKVQQNVQDIHAYDPQVICQASVFEFVSDGVNTVAVPARVFQAFNLPVTVRPFNFHAMLYPPPASQYTVYGGDMNESMRLVTPDISTQEAQLWFYYMATRYLDAGCEAIHFGQVEVMNRRDVGNVQWWGLLQKIRAYATSRNRGVILCDGHVPSGGLYYEPGLGLSQQQWQSYTPEHSWQKQLVLDFHSSPINYSEADNCSPTQQPVTLQVTNTNDASLYKRSLGGISPQGWMCRSNPFLVELDNANSNTVQGCDYDRSEDWYLWGWDEISWYAAQPSAYRNEVLKYSFHKVKCLDTNGHLEIPGMRNVTQGYSYRCNTGLGDQQSTIKTLWQGGYPGPSGWVKHNFSDEQVSNSPAPGIAKGNLIFVGDNRMYYIGTDSRIHAYIKYNSTWLTTSPSYAAGNTDNQMPAATDGPGNLVANPSGTVLYYRGTDGYVYQFRIWDDWTYTYAAMPTNQSMQQQNLRAVGSLVCPTDGRLYYIGQEAANNNARRVHALIAYGNSWTTTSPTWIAGNVNAQVQAAAGSLSCNQQATQLAYVGTDWQLHGFSIQNEWQYSYLDYKTVPLQQSPTDFTVFNAQNKLFYVAGRDPYWVGDHKIHAFNYEEDHCSSSYVQRVDPNCCTNARSADPTTVSVISAAEEQAVQPIARSKATLAAQVYPNPATTTVEVYAEDGIAALAIIGVEGQTYFSQAYTSLPQQVQLSTQELSAGLYILKITGKSSVTSHKLTIAR